MTGVGENGEVSESLEVEEAEETLALVTQEINRRLNASRVRDIADGVLFRYHQDLTKWTEKNKAKEEEAERPPFRLLDQIEYLPTDRARELVTDEIARLRKEIKEYTKVLKGL